MAAELTEFEGIDDLNALISKQRWEVSELRIAVTNVQNSLGNVVTNFYLLHPPVVSPRA